MVLVFWGYFCLLLGIWTVFLPLLFTEISRPKDSIWGALISIVGLILITDSDRFTLLTSFAVIVQGVVSIRLLLEVIQYRFEVLSEEEKTKIKSIDRFNMSMSQSFLALAKIGSIFFDLIKVFQPKEKKMQKKWVRPENPNNENFLKDENLSSNDSNELHQSIGPDKIASPKDNNIPF